MISWADCMNKGAATIGCLEPIFVNVIRALVSFAGVALFVMLIIGGFNYLFAGGDAKKTEQARGTLTNAIVGLIIIVLAYLILKTIKVFTGVDVTQFKIMTE